MRTDEIRRRDLLAGLVLGSMGTGLLLYGFVNDSDPTGLAQGVGGAIGVLIGAVFIVDTRHKGRGQTDSSKSNVGMIATVAFAGLAVLLNRMYPWITVAAATLAGSMLVLMGSSIALGVGRKPADPHTDSVPPRVGDGF